MSLRGYLPLGTKWIQPQRANRVRMQFLKRVSMTQHAHNTRKDPITTVRIMVVLWVDF